jgi:hypothetical protein
MGVGSRMSSFQCKWGCGTELHINPSVKTKTGKLIPVQVGNELPHDCHLSPYFRSKYGRIRARAEKMEALSRIDEYARKEGVEV